jgi:hypothetical protein
MQCESHYTPNMSQHTPLTTNKYENIPVYSLPQCFLNFFIVTQNKGNEIIYVRTFVKWHENLHVYTCKFEPI